MTDNERTGPTWVLIHGWGGGKELWQPLLEHLPGKVLLLDLPGFADTAGEQVEAPETWQDYLATIAGQLPERCVLLGWSLGGMLATALAARVPERIQGLVTLASNPCFVANPHWPQAMPKPVYDDFCASFAEHPRTTWTRFCALQAQGDNDRKALLQRLKEQSAPAEAVVPIWSRLLQWLEQIDNRECLAALTCPQLHMFGAGDALVPAKAAEAVAAIATAEVRVLPGRGHAPHLSEPATVANVMLDWLQSQQGISKRCIAQSFGAAASSYDEAAHVQRRVAEQVVEQAGQIAASASLLDLGCGTGFVSRALRQRGSLCEPILADLAEAMVAYAQSRLTGVPGVAADAEALPFADACYDLVLSSLALQWCQQLTVVGREVKRCLRPGGQFIFSTLGPQTLSELKQAWQQVDGYVHVNEFKSEQQVRDELSRAGLVVESLRRVPVVLRYRELLPLLRELKAIGAHNMNPGRKRGLSLRSQFRQLEQAYAASADEQGLLPVTYDVMLVTAIKP